MGESEAQKLLDFIHDHQNLSRKGFLEEYNLPFLVHPGDQETVLPKKGQKKAQSKEKKMATMKISLDEVDIDDTLPPSFRKVVVDKAWVFPLSLSLSDGEGSPLTIGRAEENDLVLDDGNVSLHHATLSWKEEEEKQIYFIYDHNSTNGTYLNGVALEPEREILLTDQSTIEFGLNRLFIFYLPETFYRCVTLV